MTYFFFILDAAILFALAKLTLNHFSGSPIKPAFIPGLCLKLAAGIGLGLLYKYHYAGGDTFNYYNEAVKVSSLSGNNVADYIEFLFSGKGIPGMKYSGQPRALFMVKLVSIVNLITYENYWFTSMFFSFFSFLGLWTLAHRLSLIYSRSKWAIVLSLLFFPSVIFWSSGIIKESIAVGAIGFLLASFIGYIFHQQKIRPQYVLFDVIMIFLLWNTKYYFAGALLLLAMAVLSTLVLQNKIALIKNSAGFQLLAFIFFCVLFLAFVSGLHPNFYFSRIAGVIVDNYHAFEQRSDVEDMIHYEELSATAPSLMFNAPKALFSGLFRPFMGESIDPLKLIAGVENMILALLSVTAFFGIPKTISTKHRLLLTSAIFYCLALSIFLSLSAPNFGTLLRYKVGFLPVFLLIITLNNPLLKRIMHWLNKS